MDHPPLTDVLVWYVAYGSNLASDRFAVYLRGGTPPGGERRYRGARDRSPPRDDRATTITHSLYFGGDSQTWGGGIAFIEPHPRTGARTLARAWLVTSGQFEDIVAQERGVPCEAIDIAAVLRDGGAVLGDGKYGTLVACPVIEGIPAVTCTGAASGAGGPQITAPTSPYLRMIAQGLFETHGLTVNEIAAYLAGAPGMRDIWERDRLLEALMSTDGIAPTARDRS